ncbi:MAG: FAD-binding oxidoreductase [Pseudomonadota bacterium]
MDDYLVIGGGIAGASAAAALAPFGTVRLWEAESALGHHASGRSAAMFIAPYGNATIRALNAASADALDEAGVLSPRHLLMLAPVGAEAALAAETAAYGARPLSPDEAVALLPILRPDAIAGAAVYEQGAEIDTDRLLQSSAATARAAGAIFETGRPVSAITRISGGWQVRAGEAAASARRLVNAAGPWADEIARMAGIAPVGLTPYRRSMARLPAPGGHNTRPWPFTLDVTEAWYAKPDAGAWLVSPCEENAATPHDAWADDMVIAEGLARYESMVCEPVTRVQTTWAGLRTFAPDRALVLGPEPDEPAFLWCAGQGGYGFQTCPAAARLLADLAVGRPSELPPDTVATLTPDRLR